MEWGRCPKRVPVAKVAVPINWLATLFSRLRHNDPKLVIKKLMDGFFNPLDLAKMGGTANLDLKLLPILLIQPDTIEAIRTLVSIREEAGVSSANTYLFPYTHKSMGHMCGNPCESCIVSSAAVKPA